MKITNVSQNIQNSVPAFEGHNLHIKQCSRILNSVPEINPQTYKKMSFLSKFFLRSFTPDRVKELAKTTCDITSKLKQRFDEKYGENNYMVIAVGRSIASIAETLNFMGGESKVIPLSELPYYLPPQIQDVDTYRNYLEQNGLSKKVISENPKKMFILMDYAVSGDSLVTAKEFLEKPELLGKSDNFIDKEINQIVKNFKILNLFYYERFKNFAPVGKLPLDKLRYVVMQSNSKTSKEGRGNICQYMRKLFLFNILDCINKDDYHDFNPEQEIKYVARFESQHYLNGLLNKALHNFQESIRHLTNNF